VDLARDVAGQARPDDVGSGGLESFAGSRDTMVRPATLRQTTVISDRVGSDNGMSAPSATHAAVGSAVTIGTRKS
jgi:hypothetical protein